MKGCYIQLDKLVPVVADEPAKGKAPAKGTKGAQPGDDAKTVPAEAWLDLTPLMFQGATETEQRIFLHPIRESEMQKEVQVEEPSKMESNAKVSDKKSVAEITNITSISPAYEEGKLYEQRHSYIIIKISLSQPLNPAIDSQVLPRSNDIARKAKTNMPPPFPNVIDAVKDYQNSINNVVQEISIEYSRMFSNEEASTEQPSDLKAQNSMLR